MDYFDHNHCECVFVQVCEKPVTCDTVHVVIALAILKSFSVLKHFDDDTIKW